MRIGIQVWGSHGDIRPMLALAEGLQASGHVVTLVITCVDSDEYSGIISSSGLTIRTIASPVIPEKNRLAKIESAIFNETNTIKQVQAILQNLFKPVESVMYHEAEILCNENDVVIGHFFHYPLQIAAEKHDCPYVSVSLVHSAIPSAFSPPVGFPNLGSSVNRLLWWVVRTALNNGIKRYPNQLREKHGLAPAKDLINDVWSSHRLNLIAVSPSVCARKKDWPDYTQVCGHLDMPNIIIEGAISEGLEEFLSKGSPPVYITFGSAMPTDVESQSSTIRLLSEAAKLAKCRAIIQASLWKECGFESSETICFVTASPYKKVFPRCAAVVHHGGAGTNQTTMLSGTPSIVVAHIAEQAFWGRELKRLGVAPKFIWRRKLSSQLLAKSITTVIGSNYMKQNAKTLSESMKKENGVNKAIECINFTFQS